MKIDPKKNATRTIVCYSALVMLCLLPFLLALPTIGQNIGDPNMIVYFNADEGGLMDEVWYYYSGIKRNSFQWDFDYGLEMTYLADFCRLVLQKAVNFTPGLFVLILRWLHLAAWILSLVALWRLIGRHFGSGWQQVLPVALLATRPAFDYLSNVIKPEPMVLLLMIIGLDYALRIIDSPSRKKLIFASAMAALAFIVKFAGLLLLPTLVAALYLAKRYHGGLGRVFLNAVRISWMVPGFYGFIIMAFPAMLIVFYTRKSTGLTWYAQHGFLGTITQNPFIIYLIIIGVFLMAASIALFILNRRQHGAVGKIIDPVNEINACVLIVSCLFAGLTALFGFKWFINPQHFINIYGQIGPIAMQKGHAISEIASKGLAGYFFQRLADKVMVFDPAVLVMCVFYVCAEIACWHKWSGPLERIGRYKRLTLLVFTLPLWANLFSSARLEQHNVLPFFSAASILGIQGVALFRRYFTASELFNKWIPIMYVILFLADIILGGSLLIKARIYNFHQREDVVFDIAKWWRDNMPYDASIVADHYNRVYIPPRQKNVRVLNWNGFGKVDQMRRLVDDDLPRYIYFKEGSGAKEWAQSPDSLLPNHRITLVKVFESSGRRYQRYPGERFVIYEVLE